MTDRIVTDANGRKHITQEPVNALGQSSPNRTDFTRWERGHLERFARQAADENLLLREDCKAALAAWRQALTTPNTNQ